MPIPATAQQIRQALEAGEGLKALVDALYAELGPITRPVAIDIGANLWLIALHGYGPLANPADYVHIADQRA